MDPRLQALNSHFAGVWVGTNYDYTKPKIVTNPVRIAITNDPQKGRLRLEYTYGTKGQKSYDHLVRFMVIDPAKSTVTLYWEGNKKEASKAGGLKELLEHFHVRCIVIPGETLRQTDDGEIVWRRSASQVA